MDPVADIALLSPTLWAAVMAAINAVSWPSDHAVASELPAVSVLIPARNEEATIRRCVRAALDAQPPVHEVVVCDDHSDDATGAILAELAAADPRLRVIQGRPLPDGWVGKVHACHQLGEAATGEVLMFLDADVTLSPDGPARVIGAMQAHDADLVTMFPHQQVGTFGEAVTLPVLGLTFMAWYPMAAIPRHPDPRLTSVSGQIMAFARAAYDDVGGYAAIPMEIVDDQAIGVRTKSLGHRVLFTTGHRTATCRMYDGFRPLWDGFSKNLYEGLGESPVLLALVVSGYFFTFVLPFVRLPVEWAVLGAPAIGTTIGVALNLGIRGLEAVRLRQPWWPIPFHPFGVLAILAIAINSWRWSRRGTVQWRGRTYAARTER